MGNTMKFTIARCPSCGERVSHTVDLLDGGGQLMAAGRKGFQYAGETDVNWDSQENALHLALRIVGEVVNLENFALVRCLNAHKWITGVKP